MSYNDIPIDIKLATAQKKLDLKGKLSSLTKEENRIVDNTINKLQFIEQHYS